MYLGVVICGQWVIICGHWVIVLWVDGLLFMGGSCCFMGAGCCSWVLGCYLGAGLSFVDSGAHSCVVLVFSSPVKSSFFPSK